MNFINGRKRKQITEKKMFEESKDKSAANSLFSDHLYAFKVYGKISRYSREYYLSNKLV